MSRITVRGNLFPFFPLCARELEELLVALTDFLALAGDVSLTCVDDSQIAELNEQFLGCSGPTNILSFPAAGQTETEPVLGELVLSRDTLARECVLYGQSAREHLVRLLAHGLLHLAGLEHGPEMFGRTEEAVEHFRFLNFEF